MNTADNRMKLSRTIVDCANLFNKEKRDRNFNLEMAMALLKAAGESSAPEEA